MAYIVLRRWKVCNLDNPPPFHSWFQPYVITVYLAVLWYRLIVLYPNENSRNRKDELIINWAEFG